MQPLFVRVGNTILNTAYIVDVEADVELSEGEDGEPARRGVIVTLSISEQYEFEGHEARALLRWFNANSFDVLSMYPDRMTA